MRMHFEREIGGVEKMEAIKYKNDIDDYFSSSIIIIKLWTLTRNEEGFRNFKENFHLLTKTIYITIWNVTLGQFTIGPVT